MERQHGVASRAQLLALGLTPRQIEHRLESGRLRALHRGVYLAGPVLTPLAIEMAAVLAIGEGAFASHTSAAGLCSLAVQLPARRLPEVTVCGRNCGRRAGISVRRVGSIGADELTEVKAIPVTSVARTLFDLATSISSTELEGALADAIRRRIVSVADMQRLLERYPRRQGGPALRGLLDEGPAFTRSRAERLLLDLIREADLPAPETNAIVDGFEVDFLWRDRGLVAEVDGWAFHSDRTAFEADPPP